jgi:hypothetical protein
MTLNMLFQLAAVSDEANKEDEITFFPRRREKDQ